MQRHKTGQSRTGQSRTQQFSTFSRAKEERAKVERAKVEHSPPRARLVLAGGWRKMVPGDTHLPETSRVSSCAHASNKPGAYGGGLSCRAQLRGRSQCLCLVRWAS